MIREFADAYDVDDAEVRAELGNEVVARGPANWEWVQAIGRILERRIPLFRKIGMLFVVQVDAYLNRPHITQAVDEIVAPFFKPGPVVIVSHSLGTIVSYRLLRQTNFTNVPLFVTLGSPLGINAVKDRISPPKLAQPAQVGHWLNGVDDRDFVALYSSLDANTFCAASRTSPTSIIGKRTRIRSSTISRTQGLRGQFTERRLQKEADHGV